MNGEEGSPDARRRPTITVAGARRMARQAFRRRLETLLFETGGNVAEMARRLGKDRSTVRYHLERYELLGDTPRRGGAASHDPLGSAKPGRAGGDPSPVD